HFKRALVCGSFWKSEQQELGVFERNHDQAPYIQSCLVCGGSRPRCEHRCDGGAPHYSEKVSSVHIELSSVRFLRKTKFHSEQKATSEMLPAKPEKIPVLSNDGKSRKLSVAGGIFLGDQRNPDGREPFFTSSCLRRSSLWNALTL